MLVLFLALSFQGPGPAELFEEPFRVQAEGTPLKINHATPLFADFDHDGLRDLLVGEFSGRLRIYRNVGSSTQPRFEGFTWFQTGEQEGRVPAG